VAHHLRGKAVEEVCGGMQDLYPIVGRERRLKEKTTYHIGGGVNDAFGQVVLGRGVGYERRN
jgi:hypothetical protein